MKLTKNSGPKKIFLLTLAALGVVYGDIGTSPLYTINEIFFGHGKSSASTAEIYGGISLVVWALTIVVAFKYIIFVLRADNHGEGGVFALYGLIEKLKKKSLVSLSVLLVIAAGLLFGDGIITPAISVISAVEGMKIVTPIFSPYIVPTTILILTGLFLIQRRGTHKVGTLFGPIIIIWFVCIGIFGLVQIIKTPIILFAFNPLNAITYLIHHTFVTILVTLGSVMLALTGGEALYADMGHFGKLPIRLGWFSVVFPTLLLNYLGQGAFLLSGSHIIDGNIFFSMVPQVMLFPFVIVATLATIIASQALISGAFSLATQAISLGLFPFMKVIHTHRDHEGQIYVPMVNWSLYIGCILLVMIFQSSDRLASAYGLAVSGVMLVTSLSMTAIAYYYWKWNRIWIILLFLPLTLIDVGFVMSNSLKFIEGGYIPISIGLGTLLIMQTWKWGRTFVKNAYEKYPKMTIQELINIRNKSASFIPRSVIVMTPDEITEISDKVPLLNQVYWERHNMISRDVIFVTVHITNESHITSKRFKIRKIYSDPKKGTIMSVSMHFGYMETPDVEAMLEKLVKHHDLPIEEDYTKWNIEVIHERTTIEESQNLLKKIRYEIFDFLHRNSDTADSYFGLGIKQSLIIQVFPVFIS